MLSRTGMEAGGGAGHRALLMLLLLGRPASVLRVGVPGKQRATNPPWIQAQELRDRLDWEGFSSFCVVSWEVGGARKTE